MTKKALRKIYREKRAGINPMQKDKFEDLMLIQFQQLDIMIPSRVMTYSAMESENEFDPQLITDYCLFKNPDQQLLFPVMDPERISLNAFAINDDTLFAKNFYGIEEPVNGIAVAPEEIDLVIVPLLTFDERGYRIGYGKGYYDRFLKGCRKDTLKIGFSFFDAETVFDEVNEFDVKLDICICPLRTYHF